MIALLAAVALHAAPAQAVSELTPAEIGRASVFAGMCSTLGWESSRERAMALAESYVAGTWVDDPATAAAINEAVQQATAEVRGSIEALQAGGDFADFRTGMRQRCEDTARRLPALMNATPETDALFEAKMAELQAGLAGN